MTSNEWQALADWWRDRAALHIAAGRLERAQVAIYRANVCKRFARQ